MGEHLLLIPKLRGIRTIEGDATRKCILFKGCTDRAVIEEYIKGKQGGYEITDEKVYLTYDNLTMGMHFKSF